MLSWRTKEQKLECLKWLGRMADENSTGSHTTNAWRLYSSLHVICVRAVMCCQTRCRGKEGRKGQGRANEVGRLGVADEVKELDDEGRDALGVLVEKARLDGRPRRRVARKRPRRRRCARRQRGIARHERLELHHPAECRGHGARCCWRCLRLGCCGALW